MPSPAPDREGRRRAWPTEGVPAPPCRPCPGGVSWHPALPVPCTAMLWLWLGCSRGRGHSLPTPAALLASPNAAPRQLPGLSLACALAKTPQRSGRTGKVRPHSRCTRSCRPWLLPRRPSLPACPLVRQAWALATGPLRFAQCPLWGLGAGELLQGGQAAGPAADPSSSPRAPGRPPAARRPPSLSRASALPGLCPPSSSPPLCPSPCTPALLRAPGTFADQSWGWGRAQLRGRWPPQARAQEDPTPVVPVGWGEPPSHPASLSPLLPTLLPW